MSVEINSFQESTFGVRDNKDLVHIFNVLRNKIYTDKLLAVVREYSNNAYDAHIEAEKRERPIEVTLPTEESPNLKIRDFGPGLSEENIRNIYTMYGASTKRATAAQTGANGQLGLGSKAAFSYTDSFTVTSIHGGVKSLYECYIDTTGLGAISLLAKKDSTEEPGIEVSIPIKVGDFDLLDEKIESFYQYFTPTPILHQQDPDCLVTIDPVSYVSKGETWAIRDQISKTYDNGNVRAVMANVAYPIDPQFLYQHQIKHYEVRSLDLFFKSGDLNISASRESLEFDSKTCKKIKDAIEFAVKEITEKSQIQINEAKDVILSKHIFANLNASGLASIANGLNEHDGTPLVSGKIQLPPSTFKEEGKPTSYLMSCKTYEIKNTREYEVFDNYLNNSNRDYPATKVLHSKILINDVKTSNILRIRNYLKLNNLHSVLCISPLEKTIADIKKDLNIDEKYYVNLSSIEPLKVVREKKEKVVNANSNKYSKHIFEWTKNVHHIDRIEGWNPTKIDPTKEYAYVTLDGFYTTAKNKSTNFKYCLMTLEEVGLGKLFNNLNIIGIKKSVIDKHISLPNLKPLEDILVNKIEEEVKEISNLQEILNSYKIKKDNQGMFDVKHSSSDYFFMYKVPSDLGYSRRGNSKYLKIKDLFLFLQTKKHLLSENSSFKKLINVAQERFDLANQHSSDINKIEKINTVLQYLYVDNSKMLLPKRSSSPWSTRDIFEQANYYDFESVNNCQKIVESLLDKIMKDYPVLSNYQFNEISNSFLTEAETKQVLHVLKNEFKD